MSASNGKLIASATTGKLLCKASNGRLLYDIAPTTVDHRYSYSSNGPGASHSYTTYYSDFDYVENRMQELADLNDSTYRPAFLATSFDDRYVRASHIEYWRGWLNGRYYFEARYYSCCLLFRSSDPVSSPAAISGATLDLACGRLFSDFGDDTFDEGIYVAGAFGSSPSDYQTPADVIANAHFRINVADCQRVTRTLTQLEYCYSRQSGHASSNSFIPIQSVSIDEAVPHLRLIPDLSTLYLWLAIDAPVPCRIPIEAHVGDRGVVASPDALHLFA